MLLQIGVNPLKQVGTTSNSVTHFHWSNHFDTVGTKDVSKTKPKDST